MRKIKKSKKTVAKKRRAKCKEFLEKLKDPTSNADTDDFLKNILQKIRDEDKTMRKKQQNPWTINHEDWQKWIYKPELQNMSGWKKERGKLK